MNPIAQEARRALTAPGYPTKNGLCQQFARMVCEKALGGKPMGTPNPGSAAIAAQRLLAQGHAFAASGVGIHGGLQPGDLLYKTQGSGGNGHVGIYLGNNQVAENSSVHYKRTGDARGIRSLEAFGAFQIVARLAVPVAAAEAAPTHQAPPLASVPRQLAFNIGDKLHVVEGAQEKGGHFNGEAPAFLAALGLDYQTNSTKTTPGMLVLNVWSKKK